MQLLRARLGGSCTPPNLWFKHVTNDVSSIRFDYCFWWIDIEMWGRMDSYTRKLLRLHYIGSRKYVIENRKLLKQTSKQKRYTRKLNHTSNQSWEHQRVSSKSEIGKLEIRFRDFETRIWTLTTSKVRTRETYTNTNSQKNEHATNVRCQILSTQLKQQIQQWQIEHRRNRLPKTTKLCACILSVGSHCIRLHVFRTYMFSSRKTSEKRWCELSGWNFRTNVRSFGSRWRHPFFTWVHAFRVWCLVSKLVNPFQYRSERNYHIVIASVQICRKCNNKTTPAPSVRY